MENILCTENDFQRNERLRADFARVQAARQRAQPELDRLQGEVELVAMRLIAARESRGTPAQRLDELKRELARREAERDRAIAEADAPVIAAREELRAHLGRFACAACGWIANVEGRYRHDAQLVEVCRDARRRIERLERDLAPLREVNATFEAARDQIEQWKPWVPDDEGWSTSGKYPGIMILPRLSDWLDQEPNRR